MKAKASTACLAAVAILLAALYALSFLAEQQLYQNLLLASAASLGAPVQDIESLERLCEEEFLLTYEIRSPATAQATASSHRVTMVGTNSHYAAILGYRLLDGGFLTKAALDAGSKHAVLNKTAAFQIFGSRLISGKTVKVNGEAWLVSGVIEDGDDENANLYVPAGLLDGRPGSVMVLLSGQGGISEAYVKNTLKGVAIHDNSHDFVSLSQAASAFGERFSVSWKLALLSALLLLILAGTGGLLKKLHFFRHRLRELYLREVFALHRADILKMAGVLLALLAGTGTMLLVSLQILESCLRLWELSPVPIELSAGDFGRRVSWLIQYQTLDTLLFAACVAMTAVCFILLFGRWRKAGRLSGRHGAFSGV